MVQEIDAPALAQRLAAGECILLLDVRQPWEHELACLPGSVLIPLPELGTRVHELRATPEMLVVAYCHHGIRSLAAAALLRQLGVGRSASLAGGIEAWSIQVDPRVPRY